MTTRGALSRVVTAILASTIVLIGGDAAVPAPANAASSIAISHGSRTRPYVALTIDDGYNSTNCKAMADILRSTGTPATFFPYGNAVSAAPAAWQHISGEGFAIANHTTTHRDMTTLAWDTKLWELDRDRQIVESVTGRAMARFFRPPYGSYNAATLSAAGAAGFPYTILWDTTFADTSTMSDAEHLRHATAGTNGSIILAHCGPATSVRILPDVIRSYRARGLTFVTLRQLLGLAPVETTPPVMNSVASKLYYPATMGTTAAVKTTWAGSDNVGVSGYRVQRQVNGGTWTTITSATGATSLTQALAFGSTYRYRVRATDTSGNVGAYLYTPSFKPLSAQETASTIGYQGTWRTSYSASFSGGGARYATAAGARATYTFTARSVAWVAERGPTRGSAQVFINGVYKTTVDLYAPTYAARQVVYAINWTSTATRTLTIVVLGTAGHPRVEVDAFVRLYQP
jgi:peptidoglycan/xylan/chitin deacetylase (PgdA/CDA1 family)